MSTFDVNRMLSDLMFIIGLTPIVALMSNTLTLFLVTSSTLMMSG